MAELNLEIGFSPCPNDTFIFYALVHQKIDTKGISFTPYIADVEELNQLAIKGQLPVTKLSFGALLQLTDNYHLLATGAALGRNCGPLLIAMPGTTLSDLSSGRIAIPGEMTTANFLLDYFLPCELTKKVYLFNQIEDAVLNQEVDAGVIIHENRFTYADKGLINLQDLGLYWENQSGHPIPLGGIACRRDLSIQVAIEIQAMIYASIKYAYDHPDEAMEYVRRYAQEMDIEVVRKHISLYVNEFSLDLGAEGRKAVAAFFREGFAQKRTKSYLDPFLSQRGSGKIISG